MSWLEIWWQSRCAQLRRPKQHIPTDGAGWLSLLIVAGLEGFIND